MHRSRLGGLSIDCRTEDLETAARFWSQALGLDVHPAEGSYIQLRTASNDPHIEVQRVAHESRVHLDIESDDIEAEVRRLEALGARRIEQVRTWVIMESPTGQRFCVVRPQRSELAREGNVWP